MQSVGIAKEHYVVIMVLGCISTRQYYTGYIWRAIGLGGTSTYIFMFHAL